jgi:hypothetical protein
MFIKSLPFYRAFIGFNFAKLTLSSGNMCMVRQGTLKEMDGKALNGVGVW